MTNVLRMLIVFVVLTLVAMVSGRGCSSIKIHESGNAAYISHEFCLINTQTKHKDFEGLATWCIEQHGK